MQRFIGFILAILLLSPGVCLAGDVKMSTVTIFNSSTGNYRSYEIQTEGNVTEVFSYQNANTIRIEQVSPGDFEVFDYGLGRGIDLPEGFLNDD